MPLVPQVLHIRRCYIVSMSFCVHQQHGVRSVPRACTHIDTSHTDFLLGTREHNLNSPDPTLWKPRPGRCPGTLKRFAVLCVRDVCVRVRLTQSEKLRMVVVFCRHCGHLCHVYGTRESFLPIFRAGLSYKVSVFPLGFFSKLLFASGD